MKLTLRELRTFISEEVDRNMRWSAGFYMGGGKGKTSTAIAPPGLGSPEEEELRDEEEYEQEELPSAVRSADRTGYARGSS